MSRIDKCTPATAALAMVFASLVLTACGGSEGSTTTLDEQPQDLGEQPSGSDERLEDLGKQPSCLGKRLHGGDADSCEHLEIRHRAVGVHCG